MEKGKKFVQWNDNLHYDVERNDKDQDFKGKTVNTRVLTYS